MACKLSLMCRLSSCEEMDENTGQLLKFILCCSVILNLFICITIGELLLFHIDAYDNFDSIVFISEQ